MFTGIVDHCGTVTEIERHQESLRLEIACGFADLVPGESIAVDGACLTAVQPAPGRFLCDVSPETLALTVAGGYRRGNRVNLERAMRLSDRLGGHLVTGHVDQRARLTHRAAAGDYLSLVIGGVFPESLRYLLKKGSVSLQGVSLTVNAVTGDGFEVMLVPHTLERTTLAELSPGDAVNLELDWMTKVILNDAGKTRSLIAEVTR